MSYNIYSSALSFSRYSSEPREVLLSNGFTLTYNDKGRPLTEAELIEALQGIDAIILGLDPLTERVIKSAKNLKLVCKHGVGLDNIDLKAAQEAGITVTNSPEGNYNAVADLTFGLILAGVRQIPMADRIIRSGSWRKVIGSEIWEKNLGVIGTGRIGLGVCHRGKGFKMTIKAFDKFPNHEAAAATGFTYASLDEIFATSDIISLHVPLTPETQNLINAESLSQMKKGAFLVNTARGELIDENALYEALKSGHLSGAALDAFREEPPVNNPLLQLEQGVVFSPHIGAYSYEANYRMGIVAAQNITRHFKGQTLCHVVV